MPDSQNYNGYTLIEIMIAITIGLILISAATATYIVQNRSSVAQESVSEINTQSKIAIDLISGEMKSAGFGAPVDLNLEPVNNMTSLITPVDSSGSPDAVTIVGGFTMIGTAWPAGSTASLACPNSIPLGSTQIRISYSGTDAPNLTDRRYLSFDGVEFALVQTCSTTSGGDCDQSAITLDRPLSLSIPMIDTDGDGTCDIGRPVYLVEDTTFCIDGNMALRRIRRNAAVATCTAVASSTNDVIADNIEELQLAYAIDTDGDGLIDDQNVNGLFDSGDYVNADLIADPASIRSLRINILARADRGDLNYGGKGNPPSIAIENRSPDPTNDNFRRRWWQTVVTMRNE